MKGRAATIGIAPEKRTAGIAVDVRAAPRDLEQVGMETKVWIDPHRPTLAERDREVGLPGDVGRGVGRVHQPDGQEQSPQELAIVGYRPNHGPLSLDRLVEAKRRQSGDCSTGQICCAYAT